MATRPIRPKIYAEPPFLGTQSQADIDEMNAHIAAGAMGYTTGSTLIRATDGVTHTLVGVGKDASFRANSAAPLVVGNVPSDAATQLSQAVAVRLRFDGDQTLSLEEKRQALENLGLEEPVKRIPTGDGTTGQVWGKTSAGYGWVTVSSGIGTTPPAPAPAPSPAPAPAPTPSPTPSPAPSPAPAPAPAPSTPTTPSTKVVNEFENFTLTTATPIKFGLNGQFFQKTLLPGTYVCDYNFFGDPLPGAQKACYLVGTDAASPPQSPNREGTADDPNYVPPNTTPAPAPAPAFTVKGIVALGDQVVGGGGNNPTPWPTLVGSDMGIPVINLGATNKTLQQIDNDFNAADNAASKFSSGTYNTLVLMPTFNDVSRNNATLSFMQTTTQSVATKARATGYKFVVLNATKRVVEGEWTQAAESVRVAYNTWLAANWQTFADGFADADAAIPYMELYDGTHPYPAGAQMIANPVESSLRVLSGQSGNTTPAPAPSTATYLYDVINMSGDSITEGGGNNPNPWPLQLKALLGSSVTVNNYAYSSTTLVQMKDNWGRSDYPGPNAVANKRNLVILGPAGTNDLTQYNASFETLKDLLLQFFAKAKAANSGYQAAWDSTMIPRKVENGYTAAHEAVRVQFNTWKRQNWASYCDKLIDFDAAVSVNDLYDGIHPGDDPGSKKMAALASSLLKNSAATQAPAPAPAPSGVSITNADGSINEALWLAMAAKMWTVDGATYRYGPAAPSNLINLPTYYQPSDKPWPQDIVGTHSGAWQLGTFRTYDGQFVGGDFASNSIIVPYIADDPVARIGVAQLQSTSTSHGTFAQKPEYPWVYYESLPRAYDAVETRYWKEQQGKTVQKAICSANAMGRPGWAVQVLTCFQNGFIATAGFNTMTNKASCQLPAGFVPTSICLTSANEFALVTAWDTNGKQGVLFVIALCGLGHNCTIEKQSYDNGDGWWFEWNEAHPGLHSLGNFAFMKVLGYIPLPGMMAPTGVSATTGHWRYGYLDGSPGEPLCGNQRFNNADGETRRVNWFPGASLDRAYAKQGEAMVISKTENKVMFVNLKPLFQYYISMYFGPSRAKYLETTNIGQNAGQWPYTFTEVASQKPTITKTITLDSSPTAVFVYPYTEKEEWRQGQVATIDGNIRVYALGGLNDTGDGSKKVEINKFNVGPNPTSITWVKEKARGSQSALVPNATRQYIYCVRGERAGKWYDFTGTATPVFRRKFQDTRVIDPICIVDTDNHGGEHYVSNFIDFTGRKVHGVRWGKIILWTYPEQSVFNMGADGNAEFEYGGAFDLPGYPTGGCTANVS